MGYNWTGLDWADTRLTTKQAAQALRKAGLDPDPAGWDEIVLAKAGRVLDAEQMRQAMRFLRLKPRQEKAK